MRTQNGSRSEKRTQQNKDGSRGARKIGVEQVDIDNDNSARNNDVSLQGRRCA